MLSQSNILFINRRRQTSYNQQATFSSVNTVIKVNMAKQSADIYKIQWKQNISFLPITNSVIFRDYSAQIKSVSRFNTSWLMHIPSLRMRIASFMTNVINENFFFFSNMSSKRSSLYIFLKINNR